MNNKLSDILHKVPVLSVIGDINIRVEGLSMNSKNISSSWMFIAKRGTHSDGHRYISEAVTQGAVAIVCEEIPKQQQNNITYVRVKDASECVGIVASNYYNHPSEKVKLIGITGTNGKTTVATLLYQMFTKLGLKSGLISTIKNYILREEYPSTHTTPDAIEINFMLSQMTDRDVKYCFIEVSSHGIHQKRINSLRFVGGVFTNLTHDHLDYHKTFLEYLKTKKHFFEMLPKSAFMLINKDDKNGMVMTQNSKAKLYTYALKSQADYRARIIENSFDGLCLGLANEELHSTLIGEFNAYNLLSVFATASILGVEQPEVLREMSTLESVSGRSQYFTSKGGVRGVVDYAHTPDALKNILQTINKTKNKDKKTITVVGCGGNRDKGKRPMMGHIATQLSDIIVFTSDNPRDEDPEKIIQEMIGGVEDTCQGKVISIPNRKMAIEYACNNAGKEDIILVAGKGHETYQEVNNKRIHFDDLETIKAILNS